MALSRGFSSDAERLAEDTRRELGLGVFDRLHPLKLAEHLDIAVRPLSDLRAVAQTAQALDAIDFLSQPGSTTLSAMTVFSGTERVVIYNDSHSPARRASSVCHELAHGLLLHLPTAALDAVGCRDWNQDAEDEADYLGAALLLPGKAARGAVTRGKSYEQVATEFGCSTQLAAWRMNTTISRKRRTAAAR